MFGARAATIGAIFRKSTRISGRARLEHTVGQITTMISTDATRIDQFAAFAHYIWVAPIQIVIGFGLLLGNLGYSALVGLGVLIIGIPFQAILVVIMFKQHGGEVEKAAASSYGHARHQSRVVSVACRKRVGADVGVDQELVEARDDERAEKSVRAHRGEVDGLNVWQGCRRREFSLRFLRGRWWGVGEGGTTKPNVEFFITTLPASAHHLFKMPDINMLPSDTIPPVNLDSSGHAMNTHSITTMDVDPSPQAPTPTAVAAPSSPGTIDVDPVAPDENAMDVDLTPPVVSAPAPPPLGFDEDIVMDDPPAAGASSVPRN
ncbi:hypothetical protein D9615_010712 [Tricholomella constricta]|uniref:ABC transmembrane type-1 domain-containing protein n=1 Tax=Tricholomella constricta TaxID=117010 RepID=A0A8H5GKZ5_9AGAR|nr:hypothetical protein D9615_010712 [Tricholomella constricta]